MEDQRSPGIYEEDLWTRKASPREVADMYYALYGWTMEMILGER